MATDALLLALVEARCRKEQADQQIRILLAYARELAAPRPYRLADLAHAAGMSISGVRMAYTHGDIELAARMPPPQCTDHFRDYWHAVTAECAGEKQRPEDPE